ncbi:GNAT family N-acetyltransferase [Salinifilum ghardaiensis]
MSLSSARELWDAQCRRFAELDRALPDRYLLPEGEPLLARTPSGRDVAGTLTRTLNEPGSFRSLWQAREVFELYPLVGRAPREGMDTLLRAWRERLSEREHIDPDSACVIAWPCRDIAATRAFLDHGCTPLTQVAIRVTDPARDTEPSGTVKMRRAGPADLDAVVDLGLTELAYAALVGASVYRPNAPHLKRAAAQMRLRSADPVWLAEREDGTPLGLAECGWVDAATSPAGNRLRPGTWGYVNCVAVRETARESGIGRELMAAAHAEFARAGAVGSFLHYNPANPLSSVFWPRQGYRPLWTIWEVRPASALR